MSILSPDCFAAKHQACSGDAWNTRTDQAHQCECLCHTTKESEK